MNEPTLFNIQKFSIHDGEGIRTTVFFKGCPLSCLWCHNPESQRPYKEVMYYADRCRHCGACAAICPSKAISPAIETDRTKCKACGLCTDVCIYGAREMVGYSMDLDTLIQKIVADTPFYEVSGGGITLSGGEPLAQNIDFIAALCQRLHRRGYRIDIDTCGHVPYERFRRVLPFIDTILFDIKHMDPAVHQKLTGVTNDLILANLKQLAADGARINLRLPLIAGVNDDPEEIEAVIRFTRPLSPVAVNLLPYHRTGSDKYERLGILNTSTFEVPDAAHMENLKKQFEQAGFINVKIGG